MKLSFRAAHNKGEPLPLIGNGKHVDVLSVCNKAIRRKSATLVMSKDDEIDMLLATDRTVDNMVVMLFRRSDPNASHQMFSSKKRGTLRKSDKKTDEAVAVSSHMFIHKDNIGTKDHPRYNAFLEEMHGISKSHVTSLLSKILKDNPYSYRDGHGEDRETFCLPKMLGVPSELLGGALSGSRVPGVTLVRAASVEGLDGGGVVVPREQKNAP